MMMEDAAASSADSGSAEQPQPKPRIDWRTGRPMLKHGAAFWKEHDARRLEQGLSVPAYCKANGLAKSTFSRYACEGKTATQQAEARPKSTHVVPVHGTAAKVQAEAMVVEVDTGQGMKLRLAGAAAERLVQQVLSRLA